MMRNYVEFGSYTLTQGYDSFILVQRLAYNMMSWQEWGVSFVYWLPDFGDSLAKSLFDESLYIKLSWYDPTSYYTVGNSTFREETLLAAGGEEQHFAYLLNHYLFGDLFKHIMVTFPIILRGMWTGKYIGLFGFLFLVPILIHLWRKGSVLDFLLYMFPVVFILGLNGFVSVNVVRYNEPLIVIFAVVWAYVLLLAGGGIKRLAQKRVKQ